MSDKSPLLEAQEKFLERVPAGVMTAEGVALSVAVGRTLSGALQALTDLPAYPRAIVEGYLIHTADSQDATEDAPVKLKIVGEIKPGDEQAPDFERGQALRIVTGCIVPEGGYSSVRPWDAEEAAGEVVVKRPFPPRFFIEEQGCDHKAGDAVIAAAKQIDAADVGNAASLGLNELSVAKQPVVTIFASGNEVIPHTEEMKPGLIRDCNSVMLAAAVNESGGQAVMAGIVKDDFDYFVSEVKKALAKSDMVVISGGTAVEGRDFISDLLREVGELVIDGVPMRSGRPLIMGVADQKPLICVAGHPPEALRGYRLFGLPAIKKLMGQAVSAEDYTEQ